MLLNLGFYETVTRNIAQIHWTASSIFLAFASVSGLIPLAPILQLLALSSCILHHHKIKWCLFRLGIWFWEGRGGQDGRRDHTLTLLQWQIHLLVFLLSVVNRRKRGVVSFTWGYVCSWVSMGRCSQSRSSGHGRLHICFVRLRQEWDRTQCSGRTLQRGVQSFWWEWTPNPTPLFISWFCYSNLHCFPLWKQKQIENSDCIYNH